MSYSYFILLAVILILPSYAFAEFEKEYKYNNDYGVYTIPYNMTNGGITNLQRSIVDCSVIIQLSSQTNDHLTIVVPRVLLDVRLATDGPDDDFFVLVDGAEVDYEESSDSLQRTLAMPLKSGASEIEMIGSSPSMMPMNRNCVDVKKESKYFELFSPKKQLQNGITSENVICKENLEKILKISNNNPVCVKPSTVSKLVERGWAKS